MDFTIRIQTFQGLETRCLVGVSQSFRNPMCLLLRLMFAHLWKRMVRKRGRRLSHHKTSDWDKGPSDQGMHLPRFQVFNVS